MTFLLGRRENLSASVPCLHVSLLRLDRVLNCVEASSN